MSVKKHIPNTITCLNLLCGAAGVVAVSHGRSDLAFYLMLSGAAFDFCDGLSARLLGAYSPVGKELDSLADMVTFGLLPAFMLNTALWNVYGGGAFFVWIPLLIAAFSGLRLARFNVDERQTESFIGLATPACAMICGSLACYMQVNPESALTRWWLSPWPIPVMSVVLSVLLVCGLPMFSMKFHKGEGFSTAMKLRTVFAVAVLCSLLAVALCGAHWTVAVFTSFISYIIINAVAALTTKKV